jgi:ornithine cyclodeaminase
MNRKISTLYLDVSDVRQVVSKIGLTAICAMVMDEIRSDFSRWEEFEKSPRTANHCENGVIELMPVSDKSFFSFKYVNGHPVNPAIGMPTIMSFGSFAEMETGVPLLISEMTILTALRTAATSVLAASYMANPGAARMAMIGNGSQSEFQILAFHELLGVSAFRVYDIDPQATRKLLKNLSGKSGITLIPCDSTGEAVQGCDIVTTCTADKKFATILKKSDVCSGMHINAIGGDCPGKTELEKGILDDARVVVEYTPQSRIEGEIQQMDPDFPVLELHEVINGHRQGREDASEVTVFDSVGFSLEDFSILKLFYRLATDNGIGSYINIIPEMEDVKNLFGVLEA